MNLNTTCFQCGIRDFSRGERRCLREREGRGTRANQGKERAREGGGTWRSGGDWSTFKEKIWRSSSPPTPFPTIPPPLHALLGYDYPSVPQCLKTNRPKKLKIFWGLSLSINLTSKSFFYIYFWRNTKQNHLIWGVKEE